jgi:lipoprotein-anchoring transpeptidase ErfK/SrfK
LHRKNYGLIAQMLQRQLGRCIMGVALKCVSAALAGAFLCLLPAAIPSACAREMVSFNGGEAPGTVVVRTRERRLYFVLGGDRALRYPVGVGRAGQQWSGHAVIDGKYIRPDWQAPPDLARGNPEVIPGGSRRNPMGAAALTLSGGEYAIHGTNNPGSIGGFVSAGCIRMYNQDIMDLYSRVGLGTPVIVMR